MEYVLTAAEMQALDRETIEGIGLPGAVLMENAGRAVARAVCRELEGRAHPRVAVVCGAGNNGGDGFVVARCLRAWGVSAAVYLAAPPGKLRGDAAIHFRAYEQTGGVIILIADAGELVESHRAIQSADVVVDAVFGTGLAREVTGHYRDVIEAMNGCAGRRVAVDVPSGMSADTGEPLGVAFAADVTVTIAFRKVGITAQPGFARAGRVEVAEIGIPRELAVAHGIRLGLLELRDAAGAVPRHDPNDHKNRRGHVLVAAGSPGKRGAARLTAWAALRAGAGLATMASPWHGGELWAPDPIMTAELDPDAPAAAEQLASLAGRAQVIAMGPGMPTSEGGRALVRAALELEVPLVLDADALNHLASSLLDQLAACPPPVVLTPHPGEAARLLAISSADVQRDRVSAARRLAEAARAVVVLKGARTLVCDGIADDGVVTVNPTGGPALATAGSGDVLAGVIAALVGQGVGPGEAARLGCYLHGLAADIADGELGPWSVTASDVLEALPAAILATAGPPRDAASAPR